MHAVPVRCDGGCADATGSGAGPIAATTGVLDRLWGRGNEAPGTFLVEAAHARSTCLIGGVGERES